MCSKVKQASNEDVQLLKKDMTMIGKTYWHNPAVIQSACVKWSSEYPQLCNVSYIPLRVNQIRVFKVKNYHLNQLGPVKT